MMRSLTERILTGSYSLPPHCIQTVCKVGLGLTYLSHTDDILAGVMARKQVLVGPATNPITFKLKAQADLNTHTSQACRLLLSMHWMLSSIGSP